MPALSVLLSLVALSTTVAAHLGQRTPPRARELPVSCVDALSPLSPTAWLLDGLQHNRTWRLRADQDLALLERYRSPGVERAAEWRRYFRGAFGPHRWQPEPTLLWSPEGAELLASQLPRSAYIELPLLSLDTPRPPDVGEPLATWVLEADSLVKPEFLPVAAAEACPHWKRPLPAIVQGPGAEREVFPLLECDGSIAAEAIDRVSVLARPPQTARPELPLPLEPATNSEQEWVPSVRLVHPRLVWLLSRITQAFPYKAIHIVSGYRRDGHDTLHRLGRALDLRVEGVPNEELFAVCRELADVGCGYYPNHPFVHVDVRPFGTGRPTWIDISNPGEASVYVERYAGFADEEAAPSAG